MLTFADTLRLKDGSIIKGKIVGFGGGKFTVAMGEGSRRKQMTFGASEVESISFDNPQDNSASYKPLFTPVTEIHPCLRAGFRIFFGASANCLNQTNKSA